MKTKRPMGKMGKVGGRRPGMRGPRGPRPMRPGPKMRRLRAARMGAPRTGGCSMILAGIIVITSLFIAL